MGWGTLAPDREARLEAQIRRCGFKSRRGYEERRPSSPACWRQCEQLLLEPSAAPPKLHAEALRLSSDRSMRAG